MEEKKLPPKKTIQIPVPDSIRKIFDEEAKKNEMSTASYARNVLYGYIESPLNNNKVI